MKEGERTGVLVLSCQNTLATTSEVSEDPSRGQGGDSFEEKGSPTPRSSALWPF